MAKKDETAEKTEPAGTTPWGSWEELLLACAVHRYGTRCWDAVAVEVQKRSSASAILNPHHCEQKYLDLKRRYSSRNDAVLVSPAAEDDYDDKAETVPWLDELRRVRVQELKREVERCDLSIVSLQLKVKKLKEEREQSFRDGDDGGDQSDREKIVHEIGDNIDVKREMDSEPVKLSPKSKPVAEDPVTGEDSERDNRSVNESNSTDGGNQKTGLESKEPEKPVEEDSFNGSSDSIEKEPVRDSVKAEPDLGEDCTTKESSDVQSSARKEGESDKMQSGCISGDEPGNEDQSPSVKGRFVKSQSLVEVLEIVRSHKLGSAFERRLKSQETADYQNLIRQHMDVETIKVRLEESCYSDCSTKFFRDLLLLFNNAILFFGKNCPEFAAAIELRKLISREINQRSKKLDLSAGEQISLPPIPLSSKPEAEPSDSLLLKPKISGPIIVCRKRSSIAAKASGSSSGGERKREQKAALLEDKPILDWKQPDKSSVSAEENQVTKKRTSDRFVYGSRSSKKNSKNRTDPNQSKSSESPSTQNQSKGSSSKELVEAKSDKNDKVVAGAKKRNAASMNRTKHKSIAENRSLLDSLKNSAINPNNNKGGADNKKSSSNGRGDGKKEQKGRQVKEQESPSTRNNGRPPKRGVAPPPSVSGKRSREGGDAEVAASRQPKKRSRK